MSKSLPPPIDDLHEDHSLDSPGPAVFAGNTLLNLTGCRNSATLWSLGGGLKFSLRHNLCLAAGHDDIELLRSLAAMVIADDPAFCSALIHSIYAELQGNFDFLFSRCDPDFFQLNAALRAAADAGSLQFINAIAPRYMRSNRQPCAWQNCPLAQAAERGHHHCLMALHRIVDPAQDRAPALALAAENGHQHCVEFLMLHSDPNANSSAAISMAMENGHSRCVDLLMPALLLLSEEAISDVAKNSKARSRNLAASRLSLISLSLAESRLLAQDAPTAASKKNARL